MEKSAGNEKEEIIGIRTRSVLWYLTFFGFAINYIIRITASIAIVDMVDPMFRRSSGNKTTVTSECYGEMNLTVSSELSTVLELKKYVSLERRLLDYLGVRHCNENNLESSSSHDLNRSSMNVTDLNGTSSNSRKC